MKQPLRSAMGGMLLTAFCSMCHGHAEEARLSVRTLAVGEGAIPEWHIAADGETYNALKWPREQASPAITATADKELQLFSKAQNAEGAVEFKIARTLTIPEGCHDVLLVAWPDDGEGKVGLMLVEDDLKQAKFNDWLVIHTGKQAVTLRYGAKSEAIQFEPRESRRWRVDTEIDQGSAVTAQMMKKDVWKTIYSTYWAAQDKQRSLILFYDAGDRTRLQRVLDLLPDAE